MQMSPFFVTPLSPILVKQNTISMLNFVPETMDVSYLIGIYRYKNLNQTNTKKMKTKTIQRSMLLALTILFTQPSFAQFRLGPTAGFNFSTIIQNDVENDFVFGLRGGLTFDLGIAKFFSVVPEVLYSQLGWKYLGTDESDGIDETGRLNYIQVPLNLVFKLKMGSNARFLIFTGAYGGYAIGGDIKLKKDGEVIQSGKIQFGTEPRQVNPLDIGLNLGLGVQIKSFFMKLQYNIGINNMSNIKQDPMTNAGLAFTLGYFIF
jgi:hypothetical protein